MLARVSTLALATLIAAPAGAQDRVLVLADPSDEALLRALRIELLPADMLVVPGEAPSGPTERARLEEVRLRAEEHDAVAAVWIEPIAEGMRVRVLWLGRGVTEAAVDHEARGRVLALVAASLLDEVRSSDLLDLVVPAAPPRALADPAAVASEPDQAPPSTPASTATSTRPSTPPSTPQDDAEPPAPHSILPRVTVFLQAGAGVGLDRDLGYRSHLSAGIAIQPGLRFAVAGVLASGPAGRPNGADTSDVLAWPRSYTTGLEVSFRPELAPFAFQLGFQARFGYGEVYRRRDTEYVQEGRFAHAIGLHLAAGVALSPSLDLLVRLDGEVHGLQEIATGGAGGASLAMEWH